MTTTTDTLSKWPHGIWRILLVALVSAALIPLPLAEAQAELAITPKHQSKAEADTKDQLLRLLRTYDASRWTFTRAIEIDDTSTPHSHPVLTLHARHLRDDDLLLSTYLHEQLHWWFVQRGKDTDAAIQDLQRLFPAAPDKPPEGSGGARSTYQHLLVCLFEHQAMEQLVGELRARQVTGFWSTDHYTWIYKTVLERGPDIERIAVQHHLTLDAAKPPAGRP